MANQAVGVILAGGRGQRFGVPKAEAILPDGRTFLEACAATLSSAGVVSVIATLPPGSPSVQAVPCRSIPLPHDGLAMLDSLRLALAAALEAAQWRVAVVHPVDHPLVLASSVQALIAALESGSREAALPSYRGKHGHPVAISRAVAAGIVAARYQAATLRDVLRAVEAVEVEVDDSGVVANCNTPERLQEGLRAVRAIG